MRKEGGGRWDGMRKNEEMIIHTLEMGRTWTRSHWRQKDRETERQGDRETERQGGSYTKQHRESTAAKQ